MNTASDDDLRRRNTQIVKIFMATAFQPEWWTMMHDDVMVVLSPAPSRGRPERLDGKTAMEAYVRGILTRVGLRCDEVVTVATMDPNLFFNEYRARMRTLRGIIFEQLCLNKVGLKDGKVILIREFWDPRRVIDALAT